MAKKSLAKVSLPQECLRMLVEMGERIRIARKRRSMTLFDLAAKMLSSPKTVQRLEKGDPGVSLGILMASLMCLGLEKDVERVAAMETDVVAFAHDRRRLLGKKSRLDATSEEHFFDDP